MRKKLKPFKCGVVDDDGYGQKVRYRNQMDFISRTVTQCDEGRRISDVFYHRSLMLCLERVRYHGRYMWRCPTLGTAYSSLAYFIRAGREDLGEIRVDDKLYKDKNYSKHVRAPAKDPILMEIWNLLRWSRELKSEFPDLTDEAIASATTDAIEKQAIA